MFNISCCSALSSQIKSALVHSVLLGSTNMEHNEFPCSVTYLARLGEGTHHHKTLPSAFLWQHTVQLVQGPWQCHRMLRPPSSSVCQHRRATVPALLDTAALGGQFSSAVGPTVRLLSRKTQGGIFPLPLSSPVAPIQGTSLDTVRAALVLGWQHRRSRLCRK